MLTLRCTIVTVALLALAASAWAEESPPGPRGFAAYYEQKLLLANDLPQGGGVPTLDGPARIHGAEVEGFISENILFGLYGNGTLKRKRNESGVADWGGGVAALVGQYRWYMGPGFFAGAGLGLGCGRISYTASASDGTRVRSVSADAIFAEPLLNVGYHFRRKIHVKAQASYIVGGLGSTYRFGEDVSSSPFPGEFTESALLDKAGGEWLGLVTASWTSDRA